MGNKSLQANRPIGKCPACQGKGVIVKVRGDEHIQRKCVVCRGSGKASGGLLRK